MCVLQIWSTAPMRWMWTFPSWQTPFSSEQPTQAGWWYSKPSLPPTTSWCTATRYGTHTTHTPTNLPRTVRADRINNQRYYSTLSGMFVNTNTSGCFIHVRVIGFDQRETDVCGTEKARGRTEDVDIGHGASKRLKRVTMGAGKLIGWLWAEGETRMEANEERYGNN